MARNKVWLILGCIAIVFSVLSAACAGTEPAPTPVAPAAPAAAVAPTAAPVLAPTAMAVAAATAVAFVTPTRVLPTATPITIAKYGGTLRYASEWPLTSEGMDPAYAVQTETRRASYLIFDNLVRLAADASYAPGLASSWDFSADGKTITFRLVKGAKFHDGTTLDAKAVKWNYDRYRDTTVGSARRSSLALVTAIEAVDDSTIAFTLSKPVRTIMGDLTDVLGHIVSPTAVQNMKSYSDRNGDFSRKPVGSGPFKLLEWAPGSRLSVVRNQDYWEKGLPYLDRIDILVATEQATRFAMLRTNEIDFTERMTPSDALAGMKDPSIRITEFKGSRYTGIKFRVTSPPWDNKNLRLAVAYALDRKKVINVLYEGVGVPAYAPIGPAYGVWYDANFKVNDYDVQKAKQKLTDAGYPSGLTVTVYCDGSSDNLLECETYQAMLAAVGITMKISTVPAGTSFSELQAGRVDATPSGISSRADPSGNLERWYHSKGASTVAYKIGYNNPAYDKLIDDALGIYDIAKARVLYLQAQQILAEDAPDVFAVHQSLFYGARAAVQNLAPRLDNVPRMQELWIAR